MSEEPGSTISDISRTTRVAFHDPATQIRLLHLNPSSTDDHISATLDVWDKDSAPSYYAISYVCGTSPARNVITVNCEAVLVRDNCFEALQQTNLHFPGSYVWVDAICINQNDLAEKSAQVAMMGKIYVEASLVLACIGPTHPFIQSIRALDGQKLAQGLTDDEDYQVERSTMTWKWYPDGLNRPETRFPATADDEAIVKSLAAEWNGLSLRPYFKRAWIVQELTGGRGYTDILCGQDRLDWILLVGIGKRLDTLNLNPLTNLGTHPFDITILILAVMIEETGAGGHFTRYLNNTCHFHCEDPRDRVFSVLPLVDWATHAQAPLLPDYSMTSFQLALELMSRLVDLDFRHVSSIVCALSPDLRCFRDKHNEAMSLYKADYQSTIRQKWTQDVESTYIIRQDSEGTLRVDPRGSRIEDEAGNVSYRQLPNYDYRYLAVNGIAPVFADGSIVALTYGSICQGDILLIGSQFDLVLRACSDATTFVIAGAALVPYDFTSPRSSYACECWQADAGKYESHRVKICLDITKEEAFADQMVRRATPVSSTFCDEQGVVSYLTSRAIGFVRKGSYVGDVTARGWQDHETLGPAHPMCSAHLSSELHRVLRNPLWFALLSGSNDFVRTRRPPRSRTASISSSEWVTEEE